MAEPPSLRALVTGNPVALAHGVIGDAWTQLILREAFYGVRRFNDWSEALHTTPAHRSIPAQVPAPHTSPTVVVSPSLQAVPSGLTGLLQAPVWGLQVPAT